MNQSAIKEQATCSPKIYVECVAAFEKGTRHGAWIDATLNSDAIMGRINDMLGASPEYGDRQWIIQDEEGFCGYELINMNLEEIGRLARKIKELGEEDKEVFCELYFDYLKSYEEVCKYMESNLIGKYRYNDDFIYDYVENCGILDNVNDKFKCYFDYDKFFKDIVRDGVILSITVKSRNTYFFYNS